ncbi:hypothetical protein GDO81_015551 [Engystomops pustulosus]|uniref:Uncharacterized protein n=1 Tax=Engystomops pustulosus TaxID=76066 RepID=A0AAV7ARX8_ENGPU|nr:hypothetical protein GDO81_015551 [Engystomops pustulosus]
MYHWCQAMTEELAQSLNFTSGSIKYKTDPSRTFMDFAQGLTVQEGGFNFLGCHLVQGGRSLDEPGPVTHRNNVRARGIETKQLITDMNGM